MRKALCVIALCLSLWSIARAGEESVSLRYRWSPGQVWLYESRQSLTIKSTVAGTTQESSYEGNTVREWKVMEVDDDGNARVRMSILTIRAEATSVAGGKKEVFDSQVPGQQGPLGELVGKPLIELTISPYGQVLKLGEPLYPGAGQYLANVRLLLYPVPPQTIAVGTGWQTDLELLMPSLGTDQKLRLRQTYRLEKLTNQVAAINLSTSLAEEIKDRARLSTFLQYLPQGKIEFDLLRGVVRSVDLKLDQTVTDFAGSGSSMQVTGSYRELLREDLARDERPGK